MVLYLHVPVEGILRLLVLPAVLLDAAPGCLQFDPIVEAPTGRLNLHAVVVRLQVVGLQELACLLHSHRLPL